MKNLLEKNFSKKSVRLLSIALGIGTVIFYLVTNSLSSSLLGMSTGGIGVFVFIFVALYIVYAIATGLVVYYSYRIYFKNNDKDISIAIAFGISCGAAAILLLNIQTVIFFIRLATMSSIYDIYELAGSVAGVEFAAKLLDFTFVVLFGNAIYQGILLNQEKGQPQETLAKEPTATATNGAEQAAQPQVEKAPNETVEKIKGFIGTTKGKIIVGGIAAACIVGFVVMNMLANQKVDVDLTKNVKIEFNGTSGKGYATPKNTSFSYDGDDEDVESFLDTVYFRVDGDATDLKNGDEVTVVAKYSKELADQYKVNPTNLKKKFKVKGLKVEYTSYKDISKKFQNKIDTTWDEYFDEGDFDDDVKDSLEYDFKRDTDIALSDKKVVAKYYAESDYEGGDKIIYVVKVTASGKERYEDNKDKKVTKYFKIELEKVSEETLAKLKTKDFSITYSSDIDATDDKKAMEEVVDYYEDSWGDYEIEEIK